MKTSIAFLKKIKKNNSSVWMQAHKEEYLAAKKEFEFLVQELIVRIGEWDKRLPMLEAKNCIFRLNRDTRFSDNKKPYKENFGAFMSYGGKKSSLPGYYFHLSPTEVFVAGGVWMPEAEHLARIRRHISENGEELEKILSDKKFKRAFKGLSDESRLKRPPKGYTEDSPYVELLKNKSFVAYANVALSDVLKPGLGKKLDGMFKLMKPLNEFLADA